MIFFSVPRARGAAVAAAIGAALVAGPVLAQPTPSTAPKSQAAMPTTKTPAKTPATQAATSPRPETVEQRIATLHSELKITPDQESKWAPVAQAMRDNAAAMEKLAAAHKGKDASMTAVDDLKTYRDFAQAHVDGLKNLISAFDDLYASMPDAQKKVADAAFQKYGSTR